MFIGEFLRGEKRLWRATARHMRGYHIGRMHHLGEGRPRDAAVAVEWYRHAAERGHSAGQRALGDMYSLGLGGTRDDFEAYKWLTLAIRSASDEDDRETATKIRNRVARFVVKPQRRTTRAISAPRILDAPPRVCPRFGGLSSRKLVDFRSDLTKAAV